MREQIKSAVAKQLGLEPDSIRLDALILDDLGADSLDAVELLMVLEDRFGVSISDEDVMDLKTIEDVARYIESKQKESR